MLIADKYTVPDKCPDNCKYQEELARYGQNAMCHWCPVLNCAPCTEDGFRLLEPADYRLDWAEAWVEFFRNGIEPKLPLVPQPVG